MEAGLPLLAISIVASVVVVAWLLGGPGVRLRRLVVSSVALGGLAICWLVLVSFGAFHAAGAVATGCGFVLGLVSLFIPWLWRLLPQSVSGARSGAAQRDAPADVSS